MISFVYLVSFLVSVQHVMAGNTNHYCYTGSSIYETEIQNCPSEDPSYTGTWYCGTMRICESFMSPARECVITRGCATAAQCNFDAELDSDGALATTYAGMSVYPSCCEAKDFPDDDTIAVAYDQICNPAAMKFSIPSTILLISVGLGVAICSSVF